ncbi:MAG: hypothetical protein ACYDEN_09655 [Acidimicrobiales bacterium]
MAVDLGVEQPRTTASWAPERTKQHGHPLSAASRWLGRRHALPVELALVTALYAAYDTGRGR